MGANRVFFPQEILDVWLEQGSVELEGDLMTLLPQGWRLRLSTAVHIVSEVAGGGDEKTGG